MAPNRPLSASAESGSVGTRWRLAHQTTAARAATEIVTCRKMVRRAIVIRQRVPTRRGLDGHAPQREPALQLGLDRQLAADLRLELQLALDRALLLPLGGDERVPGAALVVVDEVHRLAARVLECEHRAEQPVTVAAALQGLGDGV